MDNEEINRMRWAARRGMLELDLVLAPFVTSRYAELGEADRRRFKLLMECEDQDLYAWLMRRDKPSDPELAGIVGQILLFSSTAPENR